MLRFAILGAACAVVLAPGEASAQQGQALEMRAMSLDDAIAYARAHQPHVKAALARVAARTADADIPRAEWQPIIGATAQLFGGTTNNTTGTYTTPAFMDIPRIGATPSTSTGSFQPYPSTIVAGGIHQNLFDFGRIAAEAAAADALVDVAKAHARHAALEVIFDVEEAYFAVLAAKAVQKASEDAYERSKVHRDLAKAGVDAGLRPPIELTRAEADLARFDIGRVRARGGLAGAQTTLAAATGVDDPKIDAAAAPASPPDLPDLTRAIAEAGARDPRIQAAVAELHADEARTRAIGAELRPDVSLTGTISGRAGGAPPSTANAAANYNGWVPYVPNWDVGVVFSWPLFEGVISAQRDASRAMEQVRRDDLAVARHDQVAAIRIAYAKVVVAREALPGLQRSVEASVANYAQAEARFKSGLGTSVELADAEAVRTDAEIQRAIGQFDVARARAVFGRSIAEGM
jgi:outer membrane protein TolC